VKRSLELFVLSVAVLLPTFGVASDCQGKVLFEESFRKPDPAWNLGPEATLGDGKLSIKLLPDKVTLAQYQGDIFPDGTEICGTFKLTSAGQPSDPEDLHYAGIVFWAKDYSSYHVLFVSELGKFRVLRQLTADRFLEPIPWQDSSAINKGIGQPNALRIAIKKNQALIYVNGKEVGKVSGQTPEGGNLIGFWATCAKKSGCTWELSNFVVSLP